MTVKEGLYVFLDFFNLRSGFADFPLQCKICLCRSALKFTVKRETLKMQGAENAICIGRFTRGNKVGTIDMTVIMLSLHENRV